MQVDRILLTAVGDNIEIEILRKTLIYRVLYTLLTVIVTSIHVYTGGLDIICMINNNSSLLQLI